MSYRIVLLCCALASGCEMAGAQDSGASVAALDLVDPTACTAVSLTSPTSAFAVALGDAVSLSASALCPAGTTPEFNFWTKQQGAPNWDQTLTGGYSTSSTGSFTAPSAGAWCVEVAVRAQGSTPSSQARSASVCGSVGQHRISVVPIPASAFHVVDGPNTFVDSSWRSDGPTPVLQAALPLPSGVVLHHLSLFYASGPQGGSYLGNVTSRSLMLGGQVATTNIGHALVTGGQTDALGMIDVAVERTIDAGMVIEVGYSAVINIPFGARLFGALAFIE